MSSQVATVSDDIGLLNIRARIEIIRRDGLDYDTDC
jgi:hypothetical protein